MSEWTWSVSPPWVILGVVVWLFTGVLGWITWRRRGGWSTAGLELLRLLLVSLILVTLGQPERVQQRVLEEAPRVVVLHDGSGSMQTRDIVGAEGEVMSRAAWLESALATNFWAVLEPEAEVVLEQFARPETSPGPGASVPATDLNLALERVLDNEKNLKTILLLSDGDWNAGENPLTAATRLRAAGVPLFVVATGRDRALPDLVLEQVTAPSYGLLGEQISIPFRVRSFMERDISTTVVLRGEAGDLVRKEIVIPAQSQVRESILWMPRAVGRQSLLMSLPVEEGEYLRDNNERAFSVAVRTDQLKVLVVDSWPRWESRYLRNALERDPGVEVKCLLIHPELGPGRGQDYLPAFPDSPEALAPFDVVFLGDVGLAASELQSRHLKLVRGLVEQQGSGLVFLPGRRGRQASLVGTALEELMPVILEESQAAGFASAMETSLQLTLAGQGHFLTMLTGSEDRNALIWKGLPGFYWWAGVDRAKPGAQVLAVHPSMRNNFGRLPLLVIRPFGNGEVLFMGTDSAWRWRRGVEDRYHYRFWGQVVRWMAHKRHMAEGGGLRFTFSPEYPSVGERVFYQATLTDLTRWTETLALQVRATSPSGRAEETLLKAQEQGWGVYQGSFLVEESGTHQVGVAAVGAPLQLDTEILVNPVTTEQVGQPARLPLLEEMARLTRGDSGGILDLDRMVRQISLLPEAEPLEIRFRLWSNAWWGGAIVLLMTIYWAARKAAGLI